MNGKETIEQHIARRTGFTIVRKSEIAKPTIVDKRDERIMNVTERKNNMVKSDFKPKFNKNKQSFNKPSFNKGNSFNKSNFKKDFNNNKPFNKEVIKGKKLTIRKAQHLIGKINSQLENLNNNIMLVDVISSKTNKTKTQELTLSEFKKVSNSQLDRETRLVMKKAKLVKAVATFNTKHRLENGCTIVETLEVMKYIKRAHARVIEQLVNIRNNKRKVKVVTSSRDENDNELEKLDAYAVSLTTNLENMEKMLANANTKNTIIVDI